MTVVSKKVRASDLTLMKTRGQRIVMLTAYDATMAGIFDKAGIDVLLVGDSLGQVILGLDNRTGHARCDHSSHTGGRPQLTTRAACG
jgi:3-methyl-2-oxobutanoate hydroxymethyltransferase